MEREREREFWEQKRLDQIKVNFEKKMAAMRESLGYG